MAVAECGAEVAVVSCIEVKNKSECLDCPPGPKKEGGGRF